jgi:hypothetical protein
MASFPEQVLCEGNPWNLRQEIDVLEGLTIPIKNHIILAFQIDRYEELDREELKYQSRYNEEFTVREMRDHIQRFYHSRITDKQKYIELEDPYSELVKESMDGTLGSVIYLEEVMGDCIFFEGLQFLREDDGVPVYLVKLGS